MAPALAASGPARWPSPFPERGEFEKISIARGDGAASVPLWRLQVAGGAMPEKAKTSAVVGIAEGSSEVGAGRMGLEGADRCDRRKSSDRPDCFSSGESWARPPAAGREKPKSPAGPLIRMAEAR